MNIKQVFCKSALSSSTLPGLTYSLNPYRGCQHNCVYCYAPNVLRMQREHWGDVVEVKTNIPVILSKELNYKKQGVVGISTVTDPYQPLEQRYRVTRYCLEQLLTYDFPAHIQTKSALVLRDIDLVSQFSDAQVMMSIGTLDDQERKILEPGSSSIQERLEVLKRYSDAGVRTSVFFGPVYPTVSQENVSHILDAFVEHGASEIWIDSLRLKPGIWDGIKKRISPFPEMYQTFSKHIFEKKMYYQTIREEILKVGKQKNLKIIDAF